MLKGSSQESKASYEKRRYTAQGRFNGAVKENPGRSGAAGWFQLQDSTKICFKHGLGQGTNNQAELMAASKLIDLARECEVSEIEIFGDSNIVIG